MPLMTLSSSYDADVSANDTMDDHKVMLHLISTILA